MRPGRFAHELLESAFSACAPDTSEDDRSFALRVALDLLPLVHPSSRAGLLPGMIRLLQSRPSVPCDLRGVISAFEEALAKAPDARRVLDEMAALQKAEWDAARVRRNLSRPK